MKTSHVKAGLEEMDFSIVENTANLKLPCSKPAQFTFTERAMLDIDRLQSAFEERDFHELTPTHGQKDNNDFYYYTEVVGGEWKKISIKIWNNCVRIYPRENEPELTELAQLTKAIEEGLQTELKHEPLE